MRKRDKIRNPNKHLADSEVEQRKILQEEFGHEMGDFNAGKFYELAAEGKARKEKCEEEK